MSIDLPVVCWQCDLYVCMYTLVKRVYFFRFKVMFRGWLSVSYTCC